MCNIAMTLLAEEPILRSVQGLTYFCSRLIVVFAPKLLPLQMLQLLLLSFSQLEVGLSTTQVSGSALDKTLAD